MEKLQKLQIRNNIRKLRFQHDEMTQEQLAEKTGVTRQTINAIESAKYSPSLELAFRIALAFGVSWGRYSRSTEIRIPTGFEPQPHPHPHPALSLPRRRKEKDVGVRVEQAIKGGRFSTLIPTYGKKKLNQPGEVDGPSGVGWIPVPLMSDSGTSPQISYKEKNHEKF